MVSYLGIVHRVCWHLVGGIDTCVYWVLRRFFQSGPRAAACNGAAQPYQRERKLSSARIESVLYTPAADQGAATVRLCQPQVLCISGSRGSRFIAVLVRMAKQAGHRAADGRRLAVRRHVGDWLPVCGVTCLAGQVHRFAAFILKSADRC